MKKILLFLFIGLTLSAFSQDKKMIVENPLIDFYKQTITIYSDSTFNNKQEVPLDFLKFKLLEFKNGGWKALKKGLSYQPVDTVYIKDDQFIKTPEYREVLENYDPNAKIRHKAYHAKLIKQYGQKIGDAIYFGVPVIGMTTRQFLMCREFPKRRNTTQLSNGTSEQWIYDYGEFGSKYYYFINNKLTAIQE